MTSSRTLVGSALVLLSSCALGCSAFEPPPPPPPQPIQVRVSGEPGEAMQDIPIVLDGKEIGRTNAEGVGSFTFDGEDGRPFTLTIACPTGFVTSVRPLELVLRRMDRAPLYDFQCVSTDRAVLVAVRSEGASDVPIKYLGREIARTDAEGYALVHLVPKSGEIVHLTFDTSDPKHAALRPVNPQVAVGANEDGAFTVVQKFVTERGPVRRPPAIPVPRPVFRQDD